MDAPPVYESLGPTKPAVNPSISQQPISSQFQPETNAAQLQITQTSGISSSGAGNYSNSVAFNQVHFGQQPPPQQQFYQQPTGWGSVSYQAFPQQMVVLQPGYQTQFQQYPQGTSQFQPVQQGQQVQGQVTYHTMLLHRTCISIGPM